MNKRQTKTLAAVFTNPAPASIGWDATESLPLAVSCAITFEMRVRF